MSGWHWFIRQKFINGYLHDAKNKENSPWQKGIDHHTHFHSVSSFGTRKTDFSAIRVLVGIPWIASCREYFRNYNFIRGLCCIFRDTRNTRDDECGSDINRWPGAPRPGVPLSPTAPEAEGPPVQMEPVDLSIKTPVVLQVPKFPPQRLRNPPPSTKIHQPPGNFLFYAE
ncbi:hypothetical protein HHI36_021954 [Cryptolaemus montrouzieri]|uniref:Uncharacterized protein n=1 Tax=Cryptolaemus montrouzieri TaxID=559131 RepID=A0ABD2MYA9_9CUCU